VHDLSLIDRFELLRQAYGAEMYPNLAIRISRLTTLEQLLHDHMDSIASAIDADFGGRPTQETRLLEFFPTLESIRHARRHCRHWMRPQKRPVSLWFKPGRAEVVLQPLGVIGIISPWNYPVFLTLAPLAAALAAGNRAMLKLSELTPRTAALLAELVSRHFAATEVTVVEGDASVARAFSDLPFDHLLFTGSTNVGREVMRSAAANLTPVTLELGGKSPAIVGLDCDVKHAAERIFVGKTMNAGQSCIAPDYVLLPRASVDGFAAAMQEAAQRLYGNMLRAPEYAAIISDTHFRRIEALLQNAVDRGATPLALGGGGADATARRLAPILLLNVDDSMRVMHEEIFGPLLPLIPYDTFDDALAYVNARPRPLALYLFERNAQRIERVLRQTVSGGVTVNDTMLHIAQEELPFGGVGPSGMGQYHGRAGFETFSKAKAVFRQSRINSIGLLKPPYRGPFETLMKVLLR
jgi:acyl-CoA reductase-like NAD-dependent aldehyde dehydrogenase